MSHMAKYDIPAFIEQIAPMPEKGDPKRVTYLGYSQAAFQMFYGLATMEKDFYGDRIHRFIALAPCIYNDYYDWQYEETIEYYQSLYSYSDWYTAYGNQFQSTQADLYWS